MMSAPSQTQAKPTNHSSALSGQPAQQKVFLDHVIELRNRFFVVAAVLLVGCAGGYAVNEHLLKILLAPLGNERLVYLNPGGGFDFIFTVSLYFAIIVSLPVILYQLYRFLSPLMLTASRRFAILLTLSSVLLATAGILFGYFIAVPSALQFLTTFAGEYVDAQLTTTSYLSFITMYLLGLAALFQLPLILLLVNRISGPLKPSKLLASERFLIGGAFIAAAIITPTPDIANQLLLAGPVIGVYQLGVVGVVLQNREVKRRSARSVAIAPALIPAHMDIPEAVIAQVSQPVPLPRHPVTSPHIVPRTQPTVRPVVVASPNRRPTPTPVRSMDGIAVNRSVPKRPVTSLQRPVPQAATPRHVIGQSGMRPTPHQLPRLRPVDGFMRPSA